MADEEKQPETTEEAAPKKKLPIKMAAIMAVLMIVEAAGVFFVVGMTGRVPSETAADMINDNDQELTVELPLVEDKFPNMTQGPVWLWDVEIALKVKKKNEEHVSKVLEQHASEIKEGVSWIIRRAQHAQLKEPGLETLRRQLRAFLDEQLGEDLDGESRIEKVLIPRCRGFRAD